MLDLVCGAGHVSSLAAEMVGPNGSVVGIDASPDGLNKANDILREDERM